MKFLTTTILKEMPKNSNRINNCIEVLKEYLKSENVKLSKQDFFNLRKAIYILCLPNIEKNPQITKRTMLTNNFMEEIKKGKFENVVRLIA